MISAIPYVVENERAPIVVKVRERLNVPGDDCLDRGLMEVLRGLQQANGLTTHGELDEQTLGLLSLTIW